MPKGITDRKDRILLKNLDEKARSPRIMLFTCHYGSGHQMATQAISERLADCQIHLVDIYDDPLQSLDPLRGIIPELSNEYLYNKLLKKEYNRLLNFTGLIAPKALLLLRKRIERLLDEFIANHNPDILISCVPLVNSMLLSVSQKRDIPFLVITTDIDISAFCYGFQNQDQWIDQNKFRITVPFGDDPWNSFFKNHLPDSVKNSLQYQFGYPTRIAFSEQMDRATLNNVRTQYDIQDDENVILVMMGGNTAQVAKTYATLLINMTDEEISQIVGKNNDRDKLRLICLCGNVNEKASRSLMMQLNALNNSENKGNWKVQILACPGTPKIAEIVSLPELFTVISKPGGSTVNEMIKKKIPMVYHISGVPLDWERGNMEYGERQHLGIHFRPTGKINSETRSDLVRVLAYTFGLHQFMKSDDYSVPESKFDFTKNLRSTVKEMLKVS